MAEDTRGLLGHPEVAVLREAEARRAVVVQEAGAEEGSGFHSITPISAVSYST